MLESEQEVRVDLAACLRLLAHFGMDDLIFTHVSARIDSGILVNRYGMLHSEAKASELTALTDEGEVVGDSPVDVNPAALTIHLAVHGARPDAACVIHTHSVAGMAVAAQPHGLLPVCQHAMKFFGRIGYHDHEGLALGEGERERIAADLGPHQAMILRNHGLLAVGRTVAEAFHVIYHLEIACRVQVAAAGMGADSAERLNLPPDAVAHLTAEQFEAFPQPLGRREWPALLRLADRLDPSFRL